MSNASEIEFWNANAGRKWSANQERLDHLFGNVSARLFKSADPGPGMSVLDIGCGTGATSIEVGNRVGENGTVIGVDVSEPMLALARQRAQQAGTANIDFQIADAQEADLGAATFDLVVSRFGVMFFADPVAAFTNILRSAKPGARVTFCAWAAMDVNPWFRIPRDTAVKHLGKPEPVSPTAPGPMAFANVDYVTQVLTNAGARQVTASTESVDLLVSGDETAAADLGCDVGPVTRVAKEKGASAETLALIERDVAEQFSAFVRGDAVIVPATLNFFECEAV